MNIGISVSLLTEEFFLNYKNKVLMLIDKSIFYSASSVCHCVFNVQ